VLKTNVYVSGLVSWWKTRKAKKDVPKLVKPLTILKSVRILFSVPKNNIETFEPLFVAFWLKIECDILYVLLLCHLKTLC
jgi:hypothetical protein